MKNQKIPKITPIAIVLMGEFLIPGLKIIGLPWHAILLVSWVVNTAFLFYWLHFVGIVLDRLSIDPTKKLNDWFSNKFSPDNCEKSKLFLLAKGGSYLAVFSLGAAPFIWGLGVVLARNTPFRGMFLALVLGNLFKTCYVLLVWENVWNIL